MHAWAVTSYTEVVSVLTNYSADRAPASDYLDRIGLPFMKPFLEMMRQQMLFMDAPMHDRLCGICSAGFTPKRVEALHRVIESIANKLVDKIISSGRMDMLADFANTFPVNVTATMLGVPAEDHQQLEAWVIDIAKVLGNFQHRPDRMTEIVNILEDLKNYVAT